MRPAKVMTAEGISIGSSLRDIMRVYGRPYKKTEFKLNEFDDLDFYYDFGDDILSFRFKKGILVSMGLHLNFRKQVDSFR